MTTEKEKEFFILSIAIRMTANGKMAGVKEKEFIISLVENIQCDFTKMDH